MGILLLAECKCGFKEELNVDRGKIVSGPTCYAPALCTKCNHFQALNYANKNEKCSKCEGPVIYYNDKTLRKTNKKAELIRWGMDLKNDFMLPKADYKCPSCGQFKLEFKHVGYWD